MYGIVLEGGGAGGSYQVGAWQAIKELGLEFGGVAGTSVGALNGAMILQGDSTAPWRSGARFDRPGLLTSTRICISG